MPLLTCVLEAVDFVLVVPRPCGHRWVFVFVPLPHAGFQILLEQPNRVRASDVWQPAERVELGLIEQQHDGVLQEVRVRGRSSELVEARVVEHGGHVLVAQQEVAVVDLIKIKVVVVGYM